MNRRPHAHFLAAGALICCLALAWSVALAAEWPPAVQALVAEGVEILEEFDAGRDVRGFAGAVDGTPVAAYLTPDGHVIVGTRLDASGERVDEPRLRELVAQPLAERSWAELAKTDWVLDGDPGAPRVIYAFVDPSCPYCNGLWRLSRPWVDAGKLQLRHVLVGIIHDDSPNKAAAILAAAEPSRALHRNEAEFASGGVEPLESVPPGIRAKLEAHAELMARFGFQGTPGIVYRDADGGLQRASGAPRAEDVERVFGPR